MTALAIAPKTGTGYGPDVMTGVDRAIRVSTAVAVLAVAGVAAYVSYWHAYAVVCAHGETGITARLEPATIDGLVYASSMVNLYAARHRLPVPALARWLLALGIIATLAANMAQGWSHGPVGAVIAAWPAVSQVGSYELLVWIIRTAAAGDLVRGPGADQDSWHADQPGTDLGSGRPGMPDVRPEDRLGLAGLVTASTAGPLSPVHVAGLDQARGPGNRPCGSGGRPGPCRFWRCRQRPQRERDQCRGGGRLPGQPHSGQAAFRAQARGDVRQDLATLGAQSHGRSKAEPESDTGA